LRSITERREAPLHSLSPLPALRATLSHKWERGNLYAIKRKMLQNVLLFLSNNKASDSRPPDFVMPAKAGIQI
jgi:hypothetical protein